MHILLVEEVPSVTIQLNQYDTRGVIFDEVFSSTMDTKDSIQSPWVFKITFNSFRSYFKIIGENSVSQLNRPFQDSENIHEIFLNFQLTNPMSLNGKRVLESENFISYQLIDGSGFNKPFLINWIMNANTVCPIIFILVRFL